MILKNFIKRLFYNRKERPLSKEELKYIDTDIKTVQFLRENLDYNGYMLNLSTDGHLTPEDRRLLNACIWMVSFESTVGEAAEKFGYSYSKLYRAIHNKCSELSTDLYNSVCKQLKENRLKHIKVGQNNENEKK